MRYINAGTQKKTLSGWANYPKIICQVSRPEKYQDFHAKTDAEHPYCIARGQGKSYGDATLSARVILSERLNRFIAFDASKGILTAESGVVLKDVLDVIVPKGWFLPVTPGTQQVSLGGCLAADVHGKNHHHKGNFSQHVIDFELITADQQRIICSPEKNTALFNATAGGMGLTGLIGWISVQLIPLVSPYLQTRYYTAYHLAQTFEYLTQPEFDDDYSVAWIDTCAGAMHTGNMGRSIIMTGRHIEKPLDLQSYSAKRSLTLPFYLPSFFMNTNIIRWFNQYYFYQQSKKNNMPQISYYTDYFYPLDRVAHWNRLYGKQGFVQYQCVFPDVSAYEGVQAILAERCPSFLAVLKKLGKNALFDQKQSLSFPLSGMTLALDMPFRGEATLQQIKKFDSIVLAHQGRVYLAKDACLSPDSFRKMYPDYLQWLAIKKHIDPEGVFQSCLFKRLKLDKEY